MATLMCMGVEWSSADAWVFAAISHDRLTEPQSLVRVIAIADGINHAILEEAEFTRAVGRLVSVGLIGADPTSDQYWPTEAGMTLRRRWRHGLFGWIDTIPRGLRALGEPGDSGYTLPEGVFQRAVDQYLAMMTP
ncbi:MAG: hypothetical protein ACRDOO_10640 [Actinomadura sp.]